MRGFLHRSLGLLLAMALVVAGLPLAHVMPAAPMPPEQASPAQTSAAVHDHAMSAADADHALHHDGMAMIAMPDQDGDVEPAAPDPCKCLNCGMCVASYVSSPQRFATPDRRIVAVTYRMVSAGIAGIAISIDPGIPILAV